MVIVVVYAFIGRTRSDALSDCRTVRLLLSVNATLVAAVAAAAADLLLRQHTIECEKIFSLAAVVV